MFQEKFDFYSPVSLKSYNLNQAMRYQLNMLERLTPFEFDDNKDYLEEVNYEKYDSSVDELKNKAFDYINKNIKEFYENEERK